jgi:ribosome biogenesis protein Tsr3
MEITKASVLRLIKTAPSKAYHQIITTAELDKQFCDLTKELLSSYSAPFTTAEITAAEQSALRTIFFSL